MALWFGFAAVAGAFGGLLAFGVQHIQSPVQNWRLLFIIEVSPTVFNRIGIDALHRVYLLCSWVSQLYSFFRTDPSRQPF